MISAKKFQSTPHEGQNGLELGDREEDFDPRPREEGDVEECGRIKARADSHAAEVIADLKASGADSLRQIAAGLNARGIGTSRGDEWSAVQVQRVMART